MRSSNARNAADSFPIRLFLFLVPPQCERFQSPPVLGLRFLAHRRGALVAGAVHAVEPAAAAGVAGEFRGTGGVEENHRQAPMKAKPRPSSSSSKPRASRSQRRRSM